MEHLKINLFRAYFDARKNKRNTHNQLRFEINYEQELWRLYDLIASGRYKVGRSIAFIINNPVKREIFAAGFRDRVVHHLLFNYINPILEPQFIEDSYSCRVGKGTHYGIHRLAHFIQDATANYTKDAYVLKLDIRGYFMSIHRGKLMQKLRDMVTEQAFAAHQLRATKGRPDTDIDYKILSYLLEQVVFHNPTTDCVIKSSPSAWQDLPPSKSLFCSAPNCGLPIGNLTSQLFSNVYLHHFDDYMKNTLDLQYYGRYVDDFFVVHSSKRFLKKLVNHVRDFLWEHEQLKLHPKKIYLQHVSKGVKFLGVYIKPHRIYIAHKTKQAFKQAILSAAVALQLETPHYTVNRAFILSRLNSYLGIMQHYNTYNLRYREAIQPATEILWQTGCFDRHLRRYKFFKKKDVLFQGAIHT